VTREHKLALIVGFSLVLVLGVLISDHFSKARQMQMAEDTRPATAREMGASAGAAIPTQPTGIPAGQAAAQSGSPRADLMPLPIRPLADQHPTSVVLGPPGAPGATLPTPGSTPIIEPVPIAEVTKSPPTVPMQKYEVREGDTLYRIASKIYGEGKLWEKIKDFNKDKVGASGELKLGLTLQLPPKDVLLGKPYVPPDASKLQLTNDPGANAPAPTDPHAPKADASKGDLKDYVVKDGDTLISIARKQLGAGKRWQEIAEANHLSDPEALTTGMKLRIPSR